MNIERLSRAKVFYESKLRYFKRWSIIFGVVAGQQLALALFYAMKGEWWSLFYGCGMATMLYFMRETVLDGQACESLLEQTNKLLEWINDGT